MEKLCNNKLIKKMKKILLLLVLLFTANVFVQAENQKQSHKSKLRILYVGIDPTSSQKPEKDRFETQKQYETRLLRWDDFKLFLNQYFKTLKQIDRLEYKPELSKNYDVTIFDAWPNPIKKKVYEKGKNGEMIYRPAQYLPDDFSAASLTIRIASPELGASLGLKLDWCCLCLVEYALLTNIDHKIFNAPYKVTLKWEEKETPGAFLKYEHGFGKTINMWRVQTEGYEQGSSLGPGIINRGGGFTDSPDAEAISGGLSAKLSNSVALGRHGNFFHWGFSGSPRFMTDEAKKVFINAVHYISKFKGQKPMTRKVPTQWVSDNFKYKLYLNYKNMYNAQITSNEEINNYIKKVNEKKKNGQELDESEKMYAGSALYEVPSFEDFVKQLEPDLFPKFKLNLQEYKKYYKKYIDFMRPDYKNITKPLVDMDCYNFGTSFKDVKFLPTCIKALNEASTKEVALKLLKRYTNESFDNKKDWEKWYRKNKSRLFFCETAGFKYFINIYK